ncbi:hypothetical protein ACDI10_07485 [Vreelandella venusta]|uniref:hypothetical protein n=1 Tax=Vreelandella venusta TaxID=44935 RepID=UPI003559142E
MEALEFCQVLLEKALTIKETAWWNSDAVKILFPVLGTVAGAVIGYFSMRKQTERNFDAQIKTAVLSRGTELDIQFLNKKLMHFMEVQNLIDQFASIVADYCANVRNFNDHKIDNELELLSECKKKHSVLNDEYYKGFLLLGAAESKLLILGKTESQKIHHSLYERADYIFKNVFIDKNKIESLDAYTEEILSLVQEFKGLKRHLMTTLGEDINNEHNKLLKRI